MLGRFKKRDIMAGDMLFGERLELGHIFQQADTPDIERTKQVIRCLHEVTVSDKAALLLMPYAIEVAEAFVKWKEREEQECYVEPQEEARQAGVEKMAQACGDYAGVVDLAERFGYSFEQVYKMPYKDVFAIWKVDAERAKFQRRLHSVLQKKKS